MSYLAVGVGLIAGLFVCMLVLLEVGRRIAVRHPRAADEAGKVGIAAVDGAVFGLMGLILAFSFSGALGRWDARRADIRNEVNAIGTAYLRIDLLPAAARPPLRKAFRDYLDSRLAIYANLWEPDVARARRAEADARQREIWRGVLAACGDASSQPSTLLLVPALNEMFDSATTRDLTARTHPPPVMYVMLALVVLASSLLAGYGMGGSKGTSRVHMTCYALMVTLTIYVTLEIEFPRIGLVRIDSADAAFAALRQSME